MSVEGIRVPDVDHLGAAKAAAVSATTLDYSNEALLPTLAEGQLHATLALAEATDALVSAQITANRIAWAVRPGFKPSAALSAFVEKEIGL